VTLAWHAARPSDLEDVLAVCRALDLAYIGETELTIEDLRKEWEERDLEHDTWIVESDGTPAGFIQIEDRGGGRLVSDGYVDPQHAGKGVGGLLIDLAERRAAELLESQPEGVAVELHTGVLADDPGAGPLLSARGYNRVRLFSADGDRPYEPPQVSDPPEGTASSLSGSSRPPRCTRL
jgi:GNAT superfamily N-acetyltransferase